MFGLSCNLRGLSAALFWGVAVVIGANSSVDAGPRKRVPVPVPLDVIYPGDPIRPDQIGEKSFDSRIVNLDYFLSSDDVVGKVARRVLLPGKPISLLALKEADLVSAGNSVTIVFSQNGIEITGKAVALQSGRRGQVVACRNTTSGVVVRGTVTAPDTVNVGGS